MESATDMSTHLDSDRKYLKEHTPDDGISRGLFSASMRPNRPCDIQNFKVLHNPRIYGMTEWLLQYENVCRQQDTYLEQLKDLRQQFQSKESNRIYVTRNGKKAAIKSSFFWLSGIPRTQIDKKCPDKFVDQLPKKKRQIRIDSKHLSDCFCPQSDTDVLVTSECVNVTFDPLENVKPTATFTFGEEFDRKTDYEPIEIIAKRNRLHLSKYFRVKHVQELNSGDE